MLGMLSWGGCCLNIVEVGVEVEVEVEVFIPESGIIGQQVLAMIQGWRGTCERDFFCEF